MKTSIGIILLAMSSQTMALDEDKQGHLLGGMLIGAVTTLVTGKDTYGTYLGCGVGAAKELRDSMGYGQAEFADFAYTCAGAAGASWLTGKIIK